MPEVKKAIIFAELWLDKFRRVYTVSWIYIYVYIYICVCKCTRYNMHYRSRITPRQFSMSLMPEFCNETAGAPFVVIVIARPEALCPTLRMLSDHRYINRTIEIIFLCHSILVHCTYRKRPVIIINKVAREKVFRKSNLEYIKNN